MKTNIINTYKIEEVLELYTLTDNLVDFNITIYLKEDITQDGIDKIETQLKQITDISEIVFESKQETAKKLKEKNEVFETIIDSWTDETNPLLDSFSVKLKSPLNIDNIANQIKEIDGVKEVSYSENFYKQIIIEYYNKAKTID